MNEKYGECLFPVKKVNTGCRNKTSDSGVYIYYGQIAILSHERIPVIFRRNKTFFNGSGRYPADQV
jgi:hypothetical protein